MAAPHYPYTVNSSQSHQFIIIFQPFFLMSVASTIQRKCQSPNKAFTNFKSWNRSKLNHLVTSFIFSISSPQSIMSYNGGAVMAMRGKNCVAIAADRRFGVQAQMVTTDFQKIFPMGDRLYIGLAGLATDVQTV